MLRAPLARGLTTLDRSLFSRTFNLAAASVSENRNLGKYLSLLGDDGSLFLRPGVHSVRKDTDPAAKKGAMCLLLRDGIKPEVRETWSSELQKGVDAKDLHVVPYDLTLGYDDWSYVEVMNSVFPDDVDDSPSGFNAVGHIAHMTLKPKYLPYKYIIGQVLLDKNPSIKTVINKIDTIGESEYRTFAYEVLAGPDDLRVETRHGGCVFEFDYSQVYWNTKLDTEHTRIVNLFRPGEAVCDVMAGIGPFAVPAGKKGVFVWANDKNPESFKYLSLAIKKNKVSPFVRPFNEDGRDFIWQAADLVYEAYQAGESITMQPKRPRGAAVPIPEPVRYIIPPTISHFIMNLPGSAITFVHNYKGVYAGKENLFTPHTTTPLPMVHVHCFSLKPEGHSMDAPHADICQRLYDELGVRLKVGDPENAGEVSIHEVRNVAPNKTMYCASFRIPQEVAFASRTSS